MSVDRFLWSTQVGRGYFMCVRTCKDTDAHHNSMQVPGFFQHSWKFIGLKVPASPWVEKSLQFDFQSTLGPLVNLPPHRWKLPEFNFRRINSFELRAVLWTKTEPGFAIGGIIRIPLALEESGEKYLTNIGWKCRAKFYVRQRCSHRNTGMTTVDLRQITQVTCLWKTNTFIQYEK